MDLGEVNFLFFEANVDVILNFPGAGHGFFIGITFFDFCDVFAVRGVPFSVSFSAVCSEEVPSLPSICKGGPSADDSRPRLCGGGESSSSNLCSKAS